MNWRMIVPSLLALTTMAAWAQPAKRPFTVADAIGVTRIVHSDATVWGVAPSPDRRHYLVVTRRGELADNTNVYRLLLYDAPTGGHVSAGRELSRFATSSNRPGIAEPRWIDSRTVAFIGEANGELPQVRLVDVTTGQLRTLTAEKGVINNYALAAADGPLLIDVAVTPDIRDAKARGYVFGDGLWHSLWRPDGMGNIYAARALRIVRNGTTHDISLNGIDTFRWGPWPTPSISPDGRYAVIALKRTDHPRAWWTRFATKAGGLDRIYGPGGDMDGTMEPPDAMLQFQLIDLVTGAIRPLLNAPSAYGLGAGSLDAGWSPDGKTVVLANTYLPDGAMGLATVSLTDGRSLLVAPFDATKAADFRWVHWRADGKIAALFEEPAGEREEQFVLAKEGWHPGRHSDLVLRIIPDEARDLPPELARVDAHGRRTRFTDFNAALNAVELGHFDPVSWRDERGNSWSGGLLLPPDYRPGVRVPLMVYTHGNDKTSFWADGPFQGMGYSARATAARGIAVLAVNDPFEAMSTPSEIKSAVSRYASGVQALADRGLIDPSRVGIHAWSRTGYYLLNALLDCRVHYAAASASDADILSRSELTDGFMISGAMSDMEGLIGAPYWGSGTKEWAAHEPLARLDEISAPLRIEAGSWRPTWWDAYVLLRRKGRPAEYISYPDGEHSLVKPWEQQRSQQGTVDWYTFWLLGQENPNPAEPDQYVSWRAMRDHVQRDPPQKPLCGQGD